MEQSKRGLESSLKVEKETRAELEVRMAVVEDELYEVSDLKEKISLELSNLQGIVLYHGSFRYFFSMKP